MKTKLEIVPGIVSDDTDFASQGRWVDGSNMRPWMGSMQTIGGWSKLCDGISGVCRAVYPWTDNAGGQNIAFGSHTHLYVHLNGVLNDITPTAFVAGAEDGAGGPGYSAGGYGMGGYGQSSLDDYFPLTWSLAKWGENLVASPRNQTIFVWQNNPANKATAISNAPDNVTFMLVTPERQILALGCNEEISGDFNPLCIRGCDLENYNNWTTAANNNAFEHILEGSGRIVAGAIISSYVIVWTDNAVFLGEFVGETEQAYRFDRVADNCGLVGPNAFKVINQTAFWITPDLQVYAWTLGATPQLAGCRIRRGFAENVAIGQFEKIAATSIGQYGEVWWFYPDQRDGLECSRYIGLNTLDGAWFCGQMARTACVDSGPVQYPVFVTPDGTAYWHENGQTADGAPLEWRIRSADQYIDDASRVVMVRGVWPDFEAQKGAVSLSITTRQWPQSPLKHVKGPYPLTVNKRKADFRATGRIACMEFSGRSSPAFVRIGQPVWDFAILGER